MARAGKKCMFEDDVRQLLGMPQPAEMKITSDTSLEKPSPYGYGGKPSVSRQMDDRGGLQGSKEPEEGSQFGRMLFASRRLIITLLLVGLLGLGIVMMVEEIHQTSRRQLEVSYKTKGFHPRRGGAKLAAAGSSSAGSAHQAARGGGHDADGVDDDAVVTKDNWKALQAKADRLRSMREASGNTGGMRGGQHAGGKSLEAELGTLAWPGSKAGRGSSAGGGWADLHGGPHSGAKGGTGAQGEFGAGIYSW